MSAKWRALQHRHRYTYSAVVFPQDFTEALDQTPSSRFFSELKQLVSLTSTYAQLIHAKNLASAFSDLQSNTNSDEGSIALASRLYLEILFLENSLPLHRTLISVLPKCKNFQTLIRNCFRELCQEYGGVNGNGKGKRFCVSRAALSMMGTPKLGYLVEIVEECAVSVCLDVLSGLNYVVSEISEWSRPSPLVMEQCQEALSCLYYLLQRFPAKLVDAGANQDLLVCKKSSLLETIMTTVMSILNSDAFSRDCFVAAGVSFCAALQVCLCPEELGSFIMEGIFNQTSISSSKFELKDVTDTIPWKEKLVSKIQKLSALSRLCLIRGILTAVSRTVLNISFVISNDGYDGVGNPGNNDSSVKTILYDGILPELCNFCENPTDSHFNFHALTVMQICLQQIKTSMQGTDGYIEEGKGYDPISEEVGTRVLKIVWNNLEDSLSQTVKQVHLIFDLFLDIQVTLHWAEGSEKFYSFLRKIASDLLHLGPRCKGRYIPLASLTKRLGAKSILDMSPGLLFDTTKAYVDDDVCCAATTFLKCFLECLRDEYWSTDGVEGGYIKYRAHCLLPILSGLSSGFAKLRSNLNTYALPVLLELDVDSIFPMLGFIGIGCSAESTEIFYPELDSRDIVLGVEQRVAVLVSLLKVSRMLALIEGDIDWCEYSSVALEVTDLSTDAGVCDSVVHVKGIEVKIPVNYLVLALTHIDDSLRIDAAESLFINPKTASLPSSLELSLMRKAVPLNMRCCSTAFQMKWASLFRKFFSRVRTALERTIKQGTWHPSVIKCLSGSPLNGEADQSLKHRAEDLFNFMKWLSCFLFFSCYPSAPYERKIMAMELMLIMLNVWHMLPPQGKSDSYSSEISLYPYSKGLILPESTLLLVGSIIDSWDRLRESSFRILLHFPTPIPGISSPELVCEAIIWAKKLVCSPRVRESDAGALTFRLIFRKYVLELGWVVRASCNVVTQSPSGLSNGENLEFTPSSPVIEYISSLIDWLCAVVEEGEKDLSEACKNSFVHGVLLTLRYTFEEMDWDSIAVASNISSMKLLLEKILALVMRITSLALWVVSADAWYLPDEMEEMTAEGACFLESPIEMDVSASTPDDEMKIAKAEQDDGPMDQIVMVGCWLAMKEVSLLLGTIIRKVPLPTSDVPKSCSPITDGTDQLSSDIVLDLRQLEIIGNHFLEVLLKMKHNGAIDKTRAGFTALCNRLLCSNDPRLCKLTESWMEQLMERTVSKGQTVDDLLRRSAGIPAAFTAFFLSEPEGAPKRLLPKALRWLINVAKKSLTDKNKENSSCSESSSAIDSTMVPDVAAIEKISKTRDEGVVPTVHAFNILKAAFNDANLATDTSGFSAEALIVSIRSFSSSYWEVRNSACLAYTALVRRMIGFLNVQKRESARRALTGLEFFHRYPTLHTFLFNELKIATELFLEGSSENVTSNLAKVVHPSLCPMLILLSRLKPSPITSETGDPFDPFLFMPFIRKCSLQNNLRIRILASRALTGMVSNEKLPTVILNIASELPAIDNHSMTSDLSDLSNLNASFNSIHGMLLQLSSLLDTNCRNLADFSKKEDILSDLIHVLGKHSWIGSPQKCPCPILNSSFLKVLDNMLSIARTCEMSKCISVIWNLLWTLSSECLDLYTSKRPAYFDPTIAELRKQAASSYFNCAYQTSKDVNEEDLIYLRGPPPDSELFKESETQMSVTRFQERLIRSLSDALYEVRIATLKWLLLFLNSPESRTADSSNKSQSEIKLLWLSNIGLQAMLMQLLAVEKNHKCMNYILKIIYTYNMQQYNKNCGQHEKPIFVGNMDSDSVLQFWDKVVSLYKVTRHAKTREMLVCCMAVCIKRLADLFTSSICSLGNEKVVVVNPSDPSKLSVFSECIDYFVKVIQEHGDASEPINMRKAAAQSIVASGLLDQAQALSPSVSNHQVPDGNKQKEAHHLYAHKILDLWFTCIKLLEDEDDGLRKQLSLEVQKCITSGKSGSGFSSGVVPMQVEKVIEMSFEHLSSTFGHWLDYLDFLCRWVLSATNSACAVSIADPVRRVFDKEIDNHHEEKLLISQICCSHLEKLPVSKLTTEFRDNNICSVLQSWRTRFCQQLISFGNDYIGTQGGVDWIGGVGNHKDAFLPVYMNLLAFHALSNCILRGEAEDSKSMLPELLELGEAIQPFLRNPFISNLFVLVVKSHEKIAGGAVEHLVLEISEAYSAWDAFDPYFLFR
nr:thyroid adenoma-associated protein homolog [Ipomoea batatas]